jgi:hypothetical protein
MAHRSIEETFRAIAPSRNRGIPNPPTIGEGITSGSGELNASISQAAQEIAQLRAAWQQQVSLVSANTQTARGTTSAGSLGQVASGIFGGPLGFLSPVLKGILGLFGGGASQPAPLPVYIPPPPISISESVYPSGALATDTSLGQPAGPAPSAAAAVTPSARQSTAPNITVNVSAMDSQSFLDRSNDIANAVRLAMLNLHPINDVVADL